MRRDSVPKRYKLVYDLTEVHEPIHVATSSVDLFQMIHNIIGHEMVEVSIAIHLDPHMRVTGWHEVGRGSQTSCPMTMPEVFRTAIIAGAYAVILAHNHPSNSTQPSAEDNAVTSRAVLAGKTLGVPVLDHIIVTPTRGYYSYADEGLIHAKA